MQCPEKVISYTKCQKCSALEHPQKIRNVRPWAPAIWVFPKKDILPNPSHEPWAILSTWYLYNTPPIPRQSPHPSHRVYSGHTGPWPWPGGVGRVAGMGHIYIYCNYIIYVYIIIIIIINNYYSSLLLLVLLLYTIIINIKINNHNLLPSELPGAHFQLMTGHISRSCCSSLASFIAEEPRASSSWHHSSARYSESRWK